MTNTTPVTETELKAKAVAPRVTDADVEAFIVSENYFTAHDGVVGAATAAVRPELQAMNSQLELLTICILVLKNGYTVSGQSACADRKNFDPEIGRRLARADAKNKIWAHLGFELRTKLDMVEKAQPSRLMSQPQTYVGTKVIHAMPMTRGDYNCFRGWTVPADENPADEGYLVEYPDSDGYVSWSPKAVFDRSYGNPLR